MPVIGFVALQSPATMAPQLAAFRAGLNQAGLVEGQNISIAFRWAEGRYQRLPALVAELVERKVAVLVVQANAAALAARKATSTVPVVFMIGGDPVRLGLVASLHRPGGNLTGFLLFADVLIQKSLELVHDLVPRAGVVAALVNPNNPDVGKRRTDLETAAGTIGVRVQLFSASGDAEIDAAFAAIAKERIAAVVVQNDPFFNDRRDSVVAAAARHRLPAIFGERGYAVAGGLMAYGTDRAAVYRHLAAYAVRILNGDKPGDLPVQQPTKFELVINLKTAKALGLAIPDKLLALADEVIE
jgi:putative ABC transport system substrate-binding protein